jgi:hypothetical protein
MTNNPSKFHSLKVKETVEIIQGFLNILRDFSIFSIFLFLVVMPKFMYQKFVDAGFVKGELAGFTWEKREKQFKKTDGELIEAANQINSLTKVLEESNNTISKLKNEGNFKDIKIEEQLKRNNETIQQVNSVNTSIQSVLKENTPLLNPNVSAKSESLADIVNEYKIQIFYNTSKTEQKEVASEIKTTLEKAGITSSIQILPQTDKASSDQIRYFAQNERDVAYALQNILSETYSKKSFKLQTVYTPSPGSVSIFLKS